MELLGTAKCACRTTRLEAATKSVTLESLSLSVEETKPFSTRLLMGANSGAITSIFYFS